MFESSKFYCTCYSDGVVRVFTSDPLHYASPDEMKAYDEQIATSQVPTDIKPEQLPGPEALNNPGRLSNLVAALEYRHGGRIVTNFWTLIENFLKNSNHDIWLHFPGL